MQKYVPAENNEDNILAMFFNLRGPSLKSSLKDSVTQQKIQEIHDKLMEIFKSLPGQIILISRYKLDNAIVIEFRYLLFSSVCFFLIPVFLYLFKEFERC